MKLLTAFFRLIRWPNLVFIIITQCLFYFCIIVPVLPASYYLLPLKLTQPLFFLLVTASVLIAAGGYIINDYFDINIDKINKPGKMVVEKMIKRRWAIVLHLLITTIGVAISLYVSYRTSFVVGISNIICTLSLWFYSTTFKRKLLSGNIIISILTAWTILVLYFAVNTTYRITTDIASEIYTALFKIYKFAAVYAGFAFIISLVREVVKDIEDMEGDEKHDCQTMPIVWGVPVAKVFVAVWIIVLIGTLLILQFYSIEKGQWPGALYCMIFIIIPLIYTLRKFYKATVTADYHRISSLIKTIMFTGILSMLFLLLFQ